MSTDNKKIGGLTKTLQDNKTVYTVKNILVVLCLLVAGVYFFKGMSVLNKPVPKYEFVGVETFERATEAGEEEYEDETVCPVEFVNEDESAVMTVEYSFEEWEELPSGVTAEGYVYEAEDGSKLAFVSEATTSDFAAAVKALRADETGNIFGVSMAFLFVGLGLFVMTAFAKRFTAYEQIWFVSILILAAVFSLIFPEESANGINGLVIMALYLLDTFLNILCELLISKQSKWNFIVSVFVEITEIAICLVLMYRFATLASTLFFWLPCDIISFINWHKHPDKEEEELTKVRTLKGWQEVLIIAVIVIWTVGIGYLLTTIDLGSDFFKNRTLEVIVCYLDACASAVGIANGLFILFRFREQWIAWYICAALEAVMNILAGQFVLLVLKLGYFTNTTYGYIKWSRYIKRAEQNSVEDKSLF
ncbi:MAG: nicotinamide mononucleotide transporter [Lachnospiraceae bacterium]|nr:nicotinamide mononucleotide transporter [Lachnospiraceae bacterium]